VIVIETSSAAEGHELFGLRIQRQEMILYEKTFNLEKSGSEVYYTA
jgi:hypothetical protein